MKKRIVCLMLSLVFLLCSVSPAYATVTIEAAASDEWVLSPDGQKVTHGDKTYIFTDEFFESFTDDGWTYQRLTFTDPRSAEIYAESYAYVSESIANTAIEVCLFKNGAYNDLVVYVEEAYYEEFQQLKEGNASTYVTYNGYGMSVSLSPEEYAEWSKGEASEMTLDELDSYYSYMIHGCISNEVFGYQSGYVYQNIFTDELYLLRLDENGSPYADERNEVFTVYELEAGELKDRLLENYNYLPEDELDWLVTEEQDITVAAVFCAVVFGVFPLAIVIFAVVMLIVKKNSKYRRSFIILLSGAAAVLLSCITLFAILA